MTTPVYVIPPTCEDTAWFREATAARLEEIRAWLCFVKPRRGPFVIDMTGPLEEKDTPPTVCARCGAAAEVAHLERHVTTTGHLVVLACGFCTDCGRLEGWVQ
jgi:hypothetical protein